MKPWEEYQQQATDAPPWEDYAPAPSAYAERQTPRGRRHLGGTYAERVSETAGFPVSPEPDLTATERGLIGLADTPEERRQEFLRMYPAGTIQEIQLPTGQTETVYSKNPLDPPKLLDEPGVTLMDVMDRPQTLLEAPLQLGTAMLGPAAPAAQIGLQAAIPGLTHLAKEGLQELRGAQLQPMGEVLGQAGMESAADLLTGGLGYGLPALTGKVLGGPVKKGAAPLVEDAKAIEALMQTRPDLIPPMAYQMRPDHPIMEGLSKQARSTSPALQQQEMAQRLVFGDVLRDIGELPVERAGRKLVGQGKRFLREKRDELTQMFNVNPTDAGEAMKGIITKNFNKQSRAQINQAYNEAGTLAEGVRFDLTGAQQAAREVTAPVPATATEMVDSEIVDLMGRPLTQNTVQEFVNVAASPGGKVSRVAALLKKIDPEQTNWEVVKELRSQVGDAIKDLPSEDATSGAAKALWKRLTNSIENPIGGGGEFVTAWQKANALSRKRFEVFEQGRVLKVLGEDSPSGLVAEFATNPHNLTPTMKEVLSGYGGKKLTVARKGLQRGILMNDNPRALVNQWRDGNPEGFNFLFASKADRSAFTRVVDELDALKSHPIQQMIDNKGAMIEQGKTLLGKLGPQELRSTIRMYGGKDSAGGQALRLATLDDMLGKAMKIDKDGVLSLDSTALNKTIMEAKRKGLWDKVLTSQDKTNLRGMDAYVRRVINSSSDVGVSLEKQQAIASLKHPTSFIQGVHALAVNNRVLAPLLMSKTAAKLFKPTVRKTGRNVPRVKPGHWVFVGNLLGEINRIPSEESVRQ